MAIYRQVQTSFWTDTKVADDFTPEDRYFYLYLFTNPHTNLSGCYEIGMRQMAMETGYSVETIERLINRMVTVHGVIAYSKDTKEILLLKWWKYNWTSSDRFRKSLLNEIDHIKDDTFREYITEAFDGKTPILDTVYEKSDTVSVFSDTVSEISDTVYASNSNSIYITNADLSVNKKDKDNKDKDNNDIYINIIKYLNTKTGRRFSSSNKAVREVINGRVRDGYTEEDFYKVIDNKCAEWLGTEHEQYLRPSTLFAPSHFDEYLNQGIVKRKTDVKSNSQSVNEYMLGIINGEIP